MFYAPGSTPWRGGRQDWAEGAPDLWCKSQWYSGGICSWGDSAKFSWPKTRGRTASHQHLIWGRGALEVLRWWTGVRGCFGWEQFSKRDSDKSISGQHLQELEEWVPASILKEKGDRGWRAYMLSVTWCLSPVWHFPPCFTSHLTSSSVSADSLSSLVGKDVVPSAPISCVDLSECLGSWAGNSWGPGNGAKLLCRALSLLCFPPVMHNYFWTPATIGRIQLFNFCQWWVCESDFGLNLHFYHC